MLPSLSVNSNGSATAGTVYGGAFEGPLTVLESNLTFFDVDRDVELKDAVASITSTGDAAVQQHAYLVSIGDLQNVIGVLYANTLQPGSAARHAPKLKFPKGSVVFIRAVQMTEPSTAAAEATTLTIYFA